MAVYLDLYVDKGSNFNNRITIKDDITNSPVDLSYYSMISYLRKSYYSTNADMAFDCSIDDAANGIISISLTSANSSLLKPGKYVYDVLVTSSVSNTRVRILEGKVVVNPDSTY